MNLAPFLCLQCSLGWIKQSCNQIIVKQRCKHYAKGTWEKKERIIAPSCARGHSRMSQGHLKETGICAETGQLEGQIIVVRWTGEERNSAKGITSTKSLLQARYLHFKSNSCCLQICFKNNFKCLIYFLTEPLNYL